MSTVHHALFGDTGGRHGVIACSRSVDPLVEAIRARSDLAPDRPAHISWMPYRTGLQIEDVFAVMCTAPAPEASRPGMVLTHAAFLPVKDVVALDDLGRLLAALPEVPRRDLVLTPTELGPSPPPAALPPDLHAALLNAVVKIGPSQPLGWVGPEGFEDAARAVWPLLTPEERMAFSFSFAFSPKSTLKGADNGFALVRTPRSLIDRWAGYMVIDPEQLPGIEPSPTVAALLGQEGGEEVRAVMDALDLVRLPLKDHAVLEVTASYLSTFERGHASAIAVQTLTRAVGKLAPLTTQGRPLKGRIASALADGTRTAEDVLGLRNLDLVPFPDGANVLNEAVESWVSCALSGSPKRAKSDAEVLTRGLGSDAPSDWARAVQVALKRKLHSWQRGYAAPVWRWWREDGTLVEEVIARVRPATSAERDLIDETPDELPHLDYLQVSARRHGMLLLHAHAVSNATPTAEAFNVQLAVDPDGTAPHALDHIAARVGERETVLAAVRVPENERLVDLAGAAASRSPDTLYDLDASEKGWREVWTSAVEHGAEVWVGVPNPSEQRDALLQQNDGPSLTLLTAISDTEFANLLDHPERRRLWKKIPSELQARYVEATAHAWVQRFQAGSDVEWSLERELAEVVFDPARNATLFDPDRPGVVRLAVEAFGRSSFLDESAFTSWIQRLARGPRLSKSDAVLMGALVAQQRWKRAASAILNKAEWERPDFWDAVAQFTSLLSLWQRGLFQFKSGRREVSESDWWSMLEEAVVDLLDTAPELEYVWGKAGGRISDLKSSGTGRNRSTHAVSLIRKGKGVRPSEFLSALRDEYPSNNNLEILTHLGRSVGVLHHDR